MDERNHPATQQRRTRLAAEGDVARSHELNSSLIFLALIAMGAASVSGLVKWFRQFSESVWTQAPQEMTDVGLLQSTLGQVIIQFATIFGSAALVCATISIGINYLQTRKIILFRSRKTLVDTISGSVQQWFSFESVYSLVIGLLKIAAVITTVYFATRSEIQLLFQYSQSEPMDWFQQAINLIFKASFSAAICLLMFGLIDFGWRKWRYEQRIMMTADEQRDELREIQTDPNIASQRRTIRQQIAFGNSGQGSSNSTESQSN